MAIPAEFENETGTRCLSIMNSWTVGTNAVSQNVTLPNGSYIIRYDCRYDCPNESRRLDSNILSTTGGNINTALCGLVLNDEQACVLLRQDESIQQLNPGSELYSISSQAGTWEEQRFRLNVTSEKADITFRFGLKTSENQGAANQARLYIDNLRIIRLEYDGTKVDEVKKNEPQAVTSDGPLYTLAGYRMNRLTSYTSPSYRKGVVIQSGKKHIR